MKKIALSLAALLILATIAYAEPLKMTRVTVRNIGQLQALKAKAKPVKVMSGQLNTQLISQLRTNFNLVVNQTPHSGSSNAYKSGSGVILKPSAMTDPITGSELHLFGAQMDQAAVNQLIAKSDAPIKMMCNAGQQGNLGFLLGYFRNLPAGEHLYMLTMHTSIAMDRGAYLQFMAGSKGVDRSAIMQLGDDYMALLTFNPASSGDGSMQVMAKFNMPMDNAIAFLDFSYMQLAQMD